MAPPVVQGVPPVLPARGGELVTAVTRTGDEGVLPAVEGVEVHPPGEGGQGAVQLPGGRGPELSRGEVRGASSDYSKSWGESWGEGTGLAATVLSGSLWGVNSGSLCYQPWTSND